MNLDDLRAELQNQATEIDPATPVPLPIIHRRAKTLKRRRTAAVLTSAVAAVALVLAVLPNAINSSAPEPIKPPPDYTRDGIIIPGTVGDDRLEQGWISERPIDSAHFTWIPKATSVTLRSSCSSTAASPRAYLITINGRLLVDKPCDATGNSPRDVSPVPPDHVLWLDASPGQRASVQIKVVDRTTGESMGETARVAVGIYDSPQASDPAGGPVRPPAPTDDDFSKAGVVYRAKVGDETRLAAAVGEPAQATLNLPFTSTGAPLTLRLFCTANNHPVDEIYRLKVQLDDRPLVVPPGRDLCSSKTTEAALQGNLPIADRIPNGSAVNLTVSAVKPDGSLADASRLILGMGVYSRPEQRIVKDLAGGAVSLPETAESDGVKYKLAKLTAVEAKANRSVSVPIPGGKPFRLAYGSTPLGTPTADAELFGLTAGMTAELTDAGATTVGMPAGRPTTATLKLLKGQPTKGVLFLALYLPS